MEIRRKRGRMEAVKTYEKCLKEQSIINVVGFKKYQTNSGDPFFIFKYIGENTFIKPIYLGLRILEFSKLCMN